MKEIPLHGVNGIGKFAKVDDEDYEYLMQWRWYGVYIKSSSNYYAIRNASNGSSRMHVLLIGKKDGLIIDHKDGDGLNNQKSNLRHCTYSQNCYNRKNRSGSKSKYKGVSVNGKKWIARIYFNNKSYNLGVFDSENSAALAYNEKAKEFFGEYAQLNCINGGTKQGIIPPPKPNIIKKEVSVYKGELPPKSKVIPLSHDKFAIVSEEDYDWLNQWKWFVLKKSENYYIACKNGKRLGGGKREPRRSMHSLIMNPKKGMVVDHINRNPLDNRRENLRVVTHLVNSHNRKYSLRNPKYYIQLKCL